MSNLDKNLREIVQHAPDEDGYVDKWSMDSAIAQIHQAFKDEGWTNDVYRKTINDAFLDGVKSEARLMTGQEWYDRFVHELDILHKELGGGAYVWVDTPLLNAAQRASGIEETDNNA